MLVFNIFTARAPTLSASTFLQLAGNIRQCVGQTLKFYTQTSRFALLMTCFGLLSAGPLSPNFEPYFAPLTHPVTTRACARIDLLFFNFKVCDIWQLVGQTVLPIRSPRLRPFELTLLW